MSPSRAAVERRGGEDEGGGKLQMSPIRGDLIKNDRGWRWRVKPHMRGIWAQRKQVPMIYNSSNALHSF